MKKLIFCWLLSMIVISAASAQRGQDRSGYDGDFFSLEGAIELFKQSRSINDFERKLNSQDSWVNNLDLDYDGQIDYIRVEHLREGRLHAIVLQVPINRYEVQDVAVIEIEKTGRRTAILQIIGDEDLYGEELIVEPYEGYHYSDGRGGPNADFDFRRGYVNVYYWPAVRSIFGYSYRPYVSPYYYSYYPNWWRPWRPCGWNVFRPRIIIYHRHYHVVHVHRVRRVHTFYRPYRSYCPSVVQRTNVVRVRHGKTPIYRAEIKHDHPRKSIQRGGRKIDKTRNGAPNTSKALRKKSSVGKDRSTPRVDKKESGKIKNNRTKNTTRFDRGNSKPKVDRSRNEKKVERPSSRGKVKQNASSKPQRSTTKTRSSNRGASSKSIRSKPAKRQQSSKAKTKSRSSSASKKSRSSKSSRKSSTNSRSKSKKPSKSSSKKSSSKKGGRRG